MSSVRMTLQDNTSGHFGLNKFSLPIEAFTKSYLKDLKPALKLRRKRIRVKKAALKKAKKNQKKNNVAKKKALKKTNDWIQANKHAKNVAKRDILKMMRTMESDGYTIKDVIAELERQIQ